MCYKYIIFVERFLSVPRDYGLPERKENGYKVSSKRPGRLSRKQQIGVAVKNRFIYETTVCCDENTR